MKKIKAFIKKHPARVAAVVSSVVALVVSALFPDVQVDTAVVFVLASLGLGEFAQRTENAKTEAAKVSEVVGE